jgi:holliday junction DNA helicase RuvB
MISNELRPYLFSEIVGQDDAKTRLQIAIKAARSRNEPIPHILLGGSSPGIGKTTLAYAVANEYGTKPHYFNAPAIKKIPEITNLLAHINANDILIIDECHALSKAVSEVLLPALEDGKLTINIVKRAVTVDMPPFTLIGCTTEVGTIIKPLRDRFEIQFNLQPYTDIEIGQIVLRSFRKLALDGHGNVTMNIASRSRGIPRIANRLLKRVRDYAMVNKYELITHDVVNNAMRLEGIDTEGFTEIDKKYISTLFETYNSGPCGLTTMSSTIGEDSSTVAEYIEPFLLRGDYITVTKQGRVLTEKGLRFAVDISRKDVNI